MGFNLINNLENRIAVQMVRVDLLPMINRTGKSNVHSEPEPQSYYPGTRVNKDPCPSHGGRPGMSGFTRSFKEHLSRS